MRSGILCFLIALLVPTAAVGQGRTPEPKITEPEIASAIQAVQDEIYDYGFEKDYWQMGKNLGTSSHWVAEMPIYIDPDMDGHGGEAIYKYMHYTIEVYRLFTLRTDGLTVLDLDPELEFPPTQASTKTIYMDDDEVCRMKHDWLRRTFAIDTSPSLEAVKAAAHRQVLRTGHSRWQSAVMPHLQTKRHSNPER